MECRTVTANEGRVGVNAFGVRRIVRKHTITQYAIAPVSAYYSKRFATIPGLMLRTGSGNNLIPFPMPAEEARRYSGRLVPYLLFRPAPNGNGEVVVTKVVPFTATTSDPTEGAITKRAIMTEIVSVVLVDRTTGKVIARSLVDSGGMRRLHRRD